MDTLICLNSQQVLIALKNPKSFRDFFLGGGVISSMRRKTKFADYCYRIYAYIIAVIFNSKNKTNTYMVQLV